MKRLLPLVILVTGCGGSSGPGVLPWPGTYISTFAVEENDPGGGYTSTGNVDRITVVINPNMTVSAEAGVLADPDTHIVTGTLAPNGAYSGSVSINGGPLLPADGGWTRSSGGNIEGIINYVVGTPHRIRFEADR